MRPTDPRRWPSNTLLNTRNETGGPTVASWPCHLSDGPDVDPCNGGSRVTRRLCCREYPPTRGSGRCLVTPVRPPMRNGWRHCSTPPPSTGARDGTASFNSARAMLRALMCAAGPAQMVAMRTSPQPRSRRGARGGPRRSPCPRGASCSSPTASGDRPLIETCLCGDPGHSLASLSQPSSRCWRWMGAMGEAAEHVSLRSTPSMLAASGLCDERACLCGRARARGAPW